MFEVENPTRIWDTFPEPNNKTIPSEALSQNQASPRLVGASTKNQVNGRRLRRTGTSKLVMMRFRNTSPNPVGFFNLSPLRGKEGKSLFLDWTLLRFIKPSLTV